MFDCGPENERQSRTDLAASNLPSSKLFNWTNIPFILEGFEKEQAMDRRMRKLIEKGGAYVPDARLYVRLTEARASGDVGIDFIRRERPFETQLSAIVEQVIAEALLEDKRILRGAWRERVQRGYAMPPLRKVIAVAMTMVAEFGYYRGDTRQLFQRMRDVESLMPSKARAVLAAILLARLIERRGSQALS